MAYDFFPKTVEEIINKTNALPIGKNLDEILSLFDLLISKNPTPINIDLKQKNNININRALQGDFTISQIKTKAKLMSVKLKFGNGSAGNRGVNNRGNLFEPEFATALEKWYIGDPISDPMITKAIEDLNKTYNLKNVKNFKVDVVGGENTRRPLVFQPNIVLTNPKGSGDDVGKSVTDITLTADKKEIYLSLKLGGTTTFFNSGVKTILTKDQIQAGAITNKDGLKLLDMFGIDNQNFCKIFNEGGYSEIDNNAKFNRSAIAKLLESGIGYGYHIIHKFPGRIVSKKMDKTAMKKAAAIGNIKLFYGGKGGNGKRIDIVFSSSTYTFQVNIRDTQGTDGYPTRMMCNFGYK